jgi:3-phosphoshikimate 1-carboxyvinyltransferase
MTPVARVAPGSPRPRWEVRVPGSKSITNRALLLAAVADGRSLIHAPLIADDTLVMADALTVLGAGIERASGEDGTETWTIVGLGGPPRGDAELWCGMAGTVGRFLVPMLAAGDGWFTVDAHPQLRRRPLGPVLEALQVQGARIEGDSFPLSIITDGLAGGDVRVDGSVSSQFLSGLLMAAPFARETTRLAFDVLVSRPYLELTLDTMRAFGVEAAVAPSWIEVDPGGYRATELAVEPDASTASYFLASAALTGTTVRLPGLSIWRTRQGDIELVEHLEKMGCTIGEGDGDALELTGPAQLRGVTVDMNGSSDVFMTLACAAVFADAPTTIEGVGHARVKESDRVAACAENLRRLGIAVDEGSDYLRVHPGTPRAETRLPTYEDHRVAMAFALIGTRVPVLLEQPEVVAKTFPEFFERWPVTGAVVSLEEAPD